ncbi:MAG: insulinase family protein [Chloroflexi bacterium]|nr:insulinase family protein [Chloroflexota bacterium]
MRTTQFGAHSGFGAWGDESELASAAAERGDRGRGLHEEHIEKAILSNGVTVLSRYLTDPDIVAISIGARAGARNEDDATAGATKFLEKLYVQGTTRRPGPEQVQRPLTVRGSGVSAMAGSEMVVFQSQVRTADLGTMLDVVSDVILNSTFSEDRVENERRVILEELRARRASPNVYASDLFYPAVFGSHPLSRSTAGDAENTPNLTRATLVNYRDRYVTGVNTVIAVAGNLPSDRVFAQAEKYFGSLPAGEAAPASDVPPPPRNPGRIDGQAGSSQARVIIGGPLPGLRHEDRFPLAVANSVLGGSGMRLFREIRDLRGLSYDPAPSIQQFPDAGIWLAAAGTDPVNIDTVVEILNREIGRLAEEALSDDDLNNAKNYLDGSLVVGLETFSAQAFQMIRDESYGVRVLSQAHREGIARVTADDVLRVAQAYLRPETATLVVVQP